MSRYQNDKSFARFIKLFSALELIETMRYLHKLQPLVIGTILRKNIQWYNDNTNTIHRYNTKISAFLTVPKHTYFVNSKKQEQD